MEKMINFMSLIIWILKSFIVVGKVQHREVHLVKMVIVLLQLKYKLTGLLNQITILLIVKFCSLNSDKCNRNAEPLMFQSTTKDVEIPFTYSVKFIKNNDIRQQEYTLESSSTIPIQHFSILNASVVFFLFSTMIAMIMLRVLQKNITRYNGIVDDINKINLYICRRKQDDVLRPPEKDMFLYIRISNNVQIIVISLIIHFK
jgi:transmembrane 9 superfamily protein 2/4